jgi:hypothetical protein
MVNEEWEVVSASFSVQYSLCQKAAEVNRCLSFEQCSGFENIGCATINLINRNCLIQIFK